MSLNPSQNEAVSPRGGAGWFLLAIRRPVRSRCDVTCRGRSTIGKSAGPPRLPDVHMQPARPVSLSRGTFFKCVAWMRPARLCCADKLHLGGLCALRSEGRAVRYQNQGEEQSDHSLRGGREVGCEVVQRLAKAIDDFVD